MALDEVRRSAPTASAGIRIGDVERERAAQSLGEHLRAGRLAVAEYDERLEQAFAARTESELTPLFLDLPGGSPSGSPRPTAPRRSERRTYRGLPVAVRGVVALALIVGAIVWTALMAFPPLFLIPILWLLSGRRFGPHRRHGYAGPRRY